MNCIVKALLILPLALSAAPLLHETFDNGIPSTWAEVDLMGNTWNLWKATTEKPFGGTGQSLETPYLNGYSLASPSFNASALTNPVLSFVAYVQSGTFAVHVQVGSGTRWTLLTSITDLSNYFYWNHIQVALPAACKTSTCRVAFTNISTSATAYLDEVTIGSGNEAYITNADMDEDDYQTKSLVQPTTVVGQISAAVRYTVNLALLSPTFAGLYGSITPDDIESFTSPPTYKATASTGSATASYKYTVNKVAQISSLDISLNGTYLPAQITQPNGTTHGSIRATLPSGSDLTAIEFVSHYSSKTTPLVNGSPYVIYTDYNFSSGGTISISNETGSLIYYVVLTLATQASKDASLSSVSVNDGYWINGSVQLVGNVVFATMPYEANMQALTLTAYTKSANASVTYSNQNTAATGDSITVTAADGVTKKTYYLDISQSKTPTPSSSSSSSEDPSSSSSSSSSSNAAADLLSLTLCDADLFCQALDSTAIANSATGALNFSLSWQVNLATLKIQTVKVSTGATSSLLASASVSNGTSLVVTAKNGTTKKTYTLSLTKPSTASNAAALASVYVCDTVFYDPYCQTVPQSDLSLSKIQMSIPNGMVIDTFVVFTSPYSEYVVTNVGSIYSIAVTAQDGTSANYTVTVSDAAIPVKAAVSSSSVLVSSSNTGSSVVTTSSSSTTGSSSSSSGSVPIAIVTSSPLAAVFIEVHANHLTVFHAGIPLSSIQVFDLLGRPIVSVGASLDSHTELDLSKKPHGLYLARITTQNGSHRMISFTE